MYEPFDASLHHNLHTASQSGSEFDLRTIFDNTLVQSQPNLSVTVVDNHDTQPLQALEAPVEPWFKPIAYALILLRQEGFPCVFTQIYLEPLTKIMEMMAMNTKFS